VVSIEERLEAVVNGPPQRVQVFSLGRPRPGADKSERRHYVKWRVDGRDRTRSFKTRAEADRYRSGLLLAVQEGQQFDAGTGKPVTWVEHGGGPSWWSWSREWLALKWPQWSGHSRRSAVETLTLLAPQLVPTGAPAPPEGLADWLREAGYRPGTPTEGPSAAWLARWSLPLTDIDPATIERVLQAICVKADGTPTVPSVARRRRGTLGAVLLAAVRRELLARNPMERVEWRAPTTTMAIDVSTVPAPSDVEAIVEHIAALSTSGARYAALFAAVGMAGMRPSEAIALRAQDLDLPKKGWGLASLRGAVTSPGTRYTRDGAVVEAKGLKHRAAGATREVPLSPDLVQRLREHLARFEPVDAQVFTNAGGRPPTSTNYGPVWLRARTHLWTEGHPLAAATVYDLRHAAATMMLRAGVPPAEVARRLGHSVDILMRVYAGVFADDRDRSNQLIDRALRTGTRADRNRARR
jgi:integrase